MRIHFFFTLFLLISTFSFAQKAEVVILNDDIENEPLEKHFNVSRGSSHESSLPDKKTRDELLSDRKQVKDWEEFKKDLFYMDLKSKTLKELEQKYPAFSAQELTDLKSKSK